MAKRTALIRVRGEADTAYARVMAIVDEVNRKPVDWGDTNDNLRSDDPVRSTLGLVPFKLGGGGFPKDTMIVVETFEDEEPGHCLVYLRFFLGSTILQAATMGFSPKLSSGADEVIRQVDGELLEEQNKVLGF